jgi:HD-GYP domain-containing protein (c-di-GMP phosphodiesterase class II)
MIYSGRREVEPVMITAIIISGAALMIWNVYRFFKFMQSTQDVLSANSARDMRWENLAFLLLIFFLGAYVFVGITSHADLVTALILFFGSVFVAIVLTLLFHLLSTAKERSIDIAEVLVGVIDARDPNLNGHSRYVQEVTMLFYRYLPANLKKDINPVSLEYAALMHDVGKLGVPESILNKPAKLDEDEWTVMRNHPRTGVKILKPLHTFDEISSWIEFHHERPDGKGYYGLQAGEIPLAARIIAIADTYSAITMRRSYKPPRTHEEAIQIIQDVAGTQLDKDLVDVFITIPKEELVRCMPEEVRY